ncbi:MAG: hypothetical protein L0Z55_01540 [Planctomycetes bacterium]|nr:hypothetical protein [Planctomycetota bacterium]
MSRAAQGSHVEWREFDQQPFGRVLLFVVGRVLKIVPVLSVVPIVKRREIGGFRVRREEMYVSIRCTVRMEPGGCFSACRCEDEREREGEDERLLLRSTSPVATHGQPPILLLASQPIAHIPVSAVQRHPSVSIGIIAAN